MKKILSQTPGLQYIYTRMRYSFSVGNEVRYERESGEKS